MPRLPQLRQELTLTPGAPTPDGAPTWMLHDPAANRFFQLGWPAFELLSRWSLDDPAVMLEAVNRETTLSVTLEDFESLVRTLRQQHLFVATSADDTECMRRTVDANRLTRSMWLLKHYLLIRVPLWQPMPFLRRFARLAAFAYRPSFWCVVAACAVFGLFMVSRRWDEFVHTFYHYADWRSLAEIALALGLAKVLHEFGHAFTAHRYGCRVPTMGVALLVMVPVLYTDTTEAWKVPDRSRRLRIGAAGMLSEVALAAFATLAWSLLPDGPLRAGAFLLATTTWIATLAINASPFMRFDGYFLLSDWLDMPNLHERAFAFGRWRMREFLFGFRDARPEPCPRRRQRFLTAFAFVTWLYRLTVFFSIALVVYHAFFKALGIVLFCIEFGWFIARPFWREAHECWRRRGELRWCPQTIRSAAFGVMLLGVVFLPWHAGVSAPAVIGSSEEQGLYSPEASYVSADVAPARDGQRVKAGDVLAVLVSPDLEHRLREAQAEEALVRWQVEQQPFDDRLRQEGAALKKRWQGTRENVDGLTAQIAQLTLRAPFDGVVETAGEDLSAGEWLPRGERLFDVIGEGKAGDRIRGEAFVDEGEVARIAAGASATFVAKRVEAPALHCRVTGVDRVNLGTLDEPSVASQYGGPIPAQLQPGSRQLVPLHAIYRVRIGACEGAARLAQQVTGTATLGAAASSIAWRGVRVVLAVVQREAGV